MKAIQRSRMRRHVPWTKQVCLIDSTLQRILHHRPRPACAKKMARSPPVSDKRLSCHDPFNSVESNSRTRWDDLVFSAFLIVLTSPLILLALGQTALKE